MQNFIARHIQLRERARLAAFGGHYPEGPVAREDHACRHPSRAADDVTTRCNRLSLLVPQGQRHDSAAARHERHACTVR